MKTKDKNKTALVIRSEMTPLGRPVVTRHAVGYRRIESIRLREYQDGNMTPSEMVAWFLQDVEQATRSDICGATGISWAAIDGILQSMEQQRQLRRFTDCRPEEYAWKR